MTSEDSTGNSASFHRIQQELHTSQQILKALFSSVQSSLFLVDPNFNIVFFNKYAFDGSKLLYGRELFIGDSILNYRREGDEEIFVAFKENFERALTSKSVVVSEREMHYPQMSFWVRSEYTPIFDNDSSIGVLLHVQNISDRKKYENQSEVQQQQLRQIVWSQSHKTRQPLSTLLGLISILDRKSLTPENEEIIKFLEETAQKLEKVIRETVLLATLEPTHQMEDKNPNE